MYQLSADEDREISDEVIRRSIKVQYPPRDLFKIVIENKKGHYRPFINYELKL